MKTNDAGIKKWLEQKGVDWQFIRGPREAKLWGMTPGDAMLLRQRMLHNLELDARVKP